MIRLAVKKINTKADGGGKAILEKGWLAA